MVWKNIYRSSERRFTGLLRQHLQIIWCIFRDIVGRKSTENLLFKKINRFSLKRSVDFFRWLTHLLWENPMIFNEKINPYSLRYPPIFDEMSIDLLSLMSYEKINWSSTSRFSIRRSKDLLEKHIIILRPFMEKIDRFFGGDWQIFCEKIFFRSCIDLVG